MSDAQLLARYTAAVGLYWRDKREGAATLDRLRAEIDSEEVWERICAEYEARGEAKP